MNQITNLIVKLSENTNTNKMPEVLLETGILLAVLILLFWWARSSNKKAKKRAQEKYKNYTGRAEGKILDHSWVRKYSNNPDPETGKEYSDQLFIITYEFEANGQTYRGEGEASGSLFGRKTQMIAYDPADPNQNCSLYYLNSQTKSPSFLRVLIYILVRLALLIGVIYLLMRFAGYA